jgi:hypothetical protein|tara:strand:+ start:4251 stop:4559 length:309 start_codon:yes stop_codon:yes gene_type:complete
MVKMKYKRFNAILDIKLDEETYNKVESWQEETKPVDYIKSIIKDHAQDRGLLIQIDVIESDHAMIDRLDEKRELMMKEDAMNELEDEIIKNSKFCIGGNCED